MAENILKVLKTKEKTPKPLSLDANSCNKWLKSIFHKLPPKDKSHAMKWPRLISQINLPVTLSAMHWTPSGVPVATMRPPLLRRRDPCQ